MDDEQGVGLKQKPVLKSEIVIAWLVLRTDRMGCRLAAPDDSLQLLNVGSQFAALAFVLANMSVRGSG